MTFEEYLRSKKIDSEAFKKGDARQWNEFKVIFDQVNPASFTFQKLYLINRIRRAYLLKEESGVSAAAPKASRPVFKPKIN